MAVYPCGLFPLHQSFLPAPLLQQENSLVVCFLFISHSCQLHCCSKKTPLWFVSSSSVIPASSIAAARKLPCGLFPLHQSFLPAPLLQQENSLVVCFLFISHSCQLHCCSKKTPLWFVSSSSVIPASSIAAARKLPCGLLPLHQSFLPAPLLQQENSLVVCFLFISHSCQLHCCSKKTPLWFVSSSSVIPASSIAAARKLPCGLFPSSSVIPASSIAAARKLPCGLFPLHQSFLPAPLLQQENSLVVLFPLHQSFLPAPLLQQENSLVVCFLFISHSCQLHCCSKKTPLWCVSSSSVIPASSIAAARKLPCGVFPLHQSFLPAPLHAVKKTPLWFVSSSSVIPASSIAAARKLPCGLFPLHQSFLPALHQSFLPALHQSFLPALHQSFLPALHQSFLFPLHQSFLPALHQSFLQENSSSVIPVSALHQSFLPAPLHAVIPASSSSVVPVSALHQSFLPAPLLQQENSLVVCFLFISHSCQLHCCSKKTPLWFVSSSSVIPASSIAAARKLPCGLFPLHQSFLPAPLLQQENSLVVCFLFISHSCQLHCCSKKTPSHVPCHTPSVVGSNISAEPNNTPMGLCMSVYCLFNRLIHGIARSGNIRPGHTEPSIPKESVSPWMSVCFIDILCLRLWCFINILCQRLWWRMRN